MITLLSIVFGVVAASLGAIGAYFLKKGAVRISKRVLVPWQIILGGFLYTTATVFFIAGLRGTPLSFYFPFMALQYLFAALIGFFALGERATARKIAGIGIIVLGITLNSIGR